MTTRSMRAARMGKEKEKRNRIERKEEKKERKWETHTQIHWDTHSRHSASYTPVCVCRDTHTRRSERERDRPRERHRKGRRVEYRKERKGKKQKKKYTGSLLLSTGSSRVGDPCGGGVFQRVPASQSQPNPSQQQAAAPTADSKQHGAPTPDLSRQPTLVAVVHWKGSETHARCIQLSAGRSTRSIGGTRYTDIKLLHFSYRFFLAASSSSLFIYLFIFYLGFFYYLSCCFFRFTLFTFTYNCTFFRVLFFYSYCLFWLFDSIGFIFLLLLLLNIFLILFPASLYVLCGTTLCAFALVWVYVLCGTLVFVFSFFLCALRVCVLIRRHGLAHIN